MYRIRNWERFQHYRDRNPPWIKLHYELLSSRDWVGLDDASRVLAVACMLVASRFDGQIPDAEYVQRIAYLNAKPDFKPLIKCGFLIMLADASKMLDQRTEAEAEAETEAETPHTPLQGGMVNGAKHDGATNRGSRIPEDWEPSSEDRAFAQQRGFSPGEISECAAEFRDYWASIPGARGRKINWSLTWKNRIRDLGKPRAGQRPGVMGVVAVARKILSEDEDADPVH